MALVKDDRRTRIGDGALEIAFKNNTDGDRRAKGVVPLDGDGDQTGVSGNPSYIQGSVSLSGNNNLVKTIDSSSAHNGISGSPYFVNSEYIDDPMLTMAAGERILLSRLAGTVNKFGRGVVTSGSIFELWDGNAAYSFPATALMTSLSQTTDQVAMRGATIEIQGLDANRDPVTQTPTLDASDTTTVVTLSTALIRCFRMKVFADVVGDSPIRVHNAGETQDYAIISTGQNQTLMAIYTVANGETAYVTHSYAYHNPATGQDPTSNPITLWGCDKANSYAPQNKHVLGLPNNGGFEHPFRPYYKFTEKTDIFMTAAPVGKTADVSAGFDLIRVTN